MKIYNKTNQIQELRVFDRGSHREFNIYVCAHSSTELERTLVAPDLPKLKEIFQVVDETPIVKVSTVKAVEVIENTVETENVPVVEEIPAEAPVEESISEDVEEPDNFICDICGEEFASSRSLSRHKNKAHSE